MTAPTALLFAGQGAQYPGMGKDLAAQFSPAMEWCERSRRVLGLDLPGLCFNGPQEQLARTENAQPAIFLVSWIAFQLLKERMPGLAFQAAAGLSLGELTALTAAGVFDFEVGLQIARQRGRFMQEACALSQGAMAAILGLDFERTGVLCAETGAEIANLNCPGQIVISGLSEQVGRACELARAKGAKGAVLLPVAGAYHSRLMASAKPKVQAMFEGIAVRPAALEVISNVTARPHGTPEEIVLRLVQQVTSPVRWEESIRYLAGRGYSRFIELGPGKVLSGFVKRIVPAAQILHVSDVPSLENALEKLNS